MSWSPGVAGNQSQFISNGAIVNYGLGQQGMYFVAGKENPTLGCIVMIVLFNPFGTAKLTCFSDL